MPAPSFTASDAKSANIELIEGGRGTQAVHDHVVAMQANRRQGNASTKTRGEVKASNKKPWRQKGTGRARAGRVSSPIWRGGGVVFGPRPRDYSKTVSKRTKKLAFTKALSARIEAGDVLKSSDIEIKDNKTKSFLSAVNGLVDLKETKNLLIIGSFSDNTFLAARNVQDVQLISPQEVNTEQLLRYNKVVVTDNALPILSGRTAA